MSKKLLIPLNLLIVTSMLLAACAGGIPTNQVNGGAAEPAAESPGPENDEVGTEAVPAENTNGEDPGNTETPVPPSWLPATAVPVTTPPALEGIGNVYMVPTDWDQVIDMMNDESCQILYQSGDNVMTIVCPAGGVGKGKLKKAIGAAPLFAAADLAFPFGEAIALIVIVVAGVGMLSEAPRALVINMIEFPAPPNTEVFNPKTMLGKKALLVWSIMTASLFEGTWKKPDNCLVLKANGFEFLKIIIPINVNGESLGFKFDLNTGEVTFGDWFDDLEEGETNKTTYWSGMSCSKAKYYVFDIVN